MRETNWICDRCRKTLSQGAGYGIGMEINYHHPSKLELCPACETEFTIWLGKHPLWGTTLEQMKNGRHYGDGYPSEERLAELG